MESVELIRKRVDWCESEGVEILCCPEAVLGGLADYAARPTDIAEKADVAVHARNVDIARAIENSVAVIRADVAGRTADLVSYGSSGIADPDGIVLQSAQRLNEDLLVTDLDTAPRKRRRGWDGSRNSTVMDE
ncbi:MAG: nitrilase-related carbon-nitrogen hydrolase [Acidobacteriota bacterium]